MTPNSSFIRAADFDAGSFVEGAACAVPIIFSFDANGLVLQKDIRTCTGAQRVHIYLTNACDPTDQAKVETYLEVQNNNFLPNIPPCGDNALFNSLATLNPDPNAKIFPMSLVSHGIAVAFASSQSPYLLKWNEHLNAGAQANSGTITDKHVQLGSAITNPIPTVWKSELPVTSCCAEPYTIALWTKNSLGNVSFVESYTDVQKPPSDNPNQPVFYAYNGLSTRFIPNQPFNIPVSVWNKGSYSPINSPLSFSHLNGDLSFKVSSINVKPIDLLVKDAQNNENALGTYLEVSPETLIKGAFKLSSTNTVSSYTMTDLSRTYEWQLDGKLVASSTNTYKTPPNLSVGKHTLKVKGALGLVFDETEITITVANSVNTEEQNDTDILVFPNPIVDYLEIQTNSSHEYLAEFSDITGRIVLQTVINNPFSQLDCTGLRTGIYLLKLSTDKAVLFVKKIVKQ